MRELWNYLSFRPTLQPPLLPPNQQPFIPPAPGQVNGPFPIPSQLRHRSHHPVNSVDASLTHFLRMMEMQFRHKQQQEGGKLDGACEDLFFCEVALLGRQPNADAIHRMLYNVALEWDAQRKKRNFSYLISCFPEPLTVTPKRVDSATFSQQSSDKIATLLTVKIQLNFPPTTKFPDKCIICVKIEVLTNWK